MGMDDRDGAYRSRGQPPRRRPYDGDEPPTNSPSRGPREMNSPRSRPPRRENDPGGDYDRPARDPRSAPRGGSSGRNERESYDRDGYDRRPRPANPPRSDRRGYDDQDRPSRSSRNDPSASNARGERNMRSGRPPMRDDGWSDPRSARAGARGASAADSNERMRRAAPPGGRGGLWSDEAPSYGGLNARDPRARARAVQREEEEEEQGSPAAGIAKALGVIALALVLGAGSAYGYFVVSTPKLHISPSQQALPTAPASTPATPATTPSPSATKSALRQPPTPARTLFIG